MPLPIVVVIGSVIAATVGGGNVAYRAKKNNDAKCIMKEAKSTERESIKKLEWENETTTRLMDKIGKKELQVLSSFGEYSDMIELIQNRPEFQKYKDSSVKLPNYNVQDLRDVSSGARTLLSSISGAVVGTAGGFAAAGAVTSAVTALGTASTGVAISSLHGAAAANATLAALGGGSIAAGGGGMALGTTILGISALGAAILIGGIVFNIAGAKTLQRAKEFSAEAEKLEKEVNQICDFLSELNEYASIFYDYLEKIADLYEGRLRKMRIIFQERKKVNWNSLSRNDREIIQNAVLLVGMLYKMCNINLVISTEGDSVNIANTKGIAEINRDAKFFLKGQ